MGRLNSKNIFLIDGIGALFSVLCLLVLFNFEDFFGMPRSYLILFIFLASVFSIFSLSCYFLKPANWKKYLTIIAVLNFLYCLLTGISVFRNVNSLTLPGFIFFAAELVVILILVGYEWKLLKTK